MAGHCDVIEVEPQPYWPRAADPAAPDAAARPNLAALDRIRRTGRPLLAHSVGYPVGGARLGEAQDLAELSAALEWLAPPWWSEHLSLLETRVDGTPRRFGFLMPPVQSPAGAERVVAHIERLQDRFGLPFAFETGTSYLRPLPGEIPDGAYWGEVAERADCGILLDLHNIWTNARNGRQPVEAVLADLPLGRVWEVHVAAGQERDGYWLDSHSGLPSPALLDLLARTAPRLPALAAAILEIIPEYVDAQQIGPEDLIACLAAMRHALRTGGPPPGPPAPGRAAGNGDALPGPERWERALAAALDRRPPDPAFAGLAADPGLGIYRDLIEAVRKGMLADALPFSLAYLWRSLGEARLLGELGAFWAHRHPEQVPSREAANFAAFMADRPAPPWLGDVLALELAQHRASLTGTTQALRLGCDPHRLLAYAAAPERMPCPAAAETLVEVPPA